MKKLSSPLQACAGRVFLHGVSVAGCTDSPIVGCWEAYMYSREAGCRVCHAALGRRHFVRQKMCVIAASMKPLMCPRQVFREMPKGVEARRAAFCLMQAQGTLLS